MVSILALWLPILVAAALVFVASSFIHMVLTYHKADTGPMPDEATVMDALRPFKIAPGDYVMPCAGTTKKMRSPDFVERSNAGPVAFVTVLPNGPMAIGKSLAQWFVYSLLVGAIAGYVAGIALAPGTDYRVVFRIVSTVAFAGYALALMQNTIWYYRGWGFTLRTMFDGLVYALLTAGAFAWLWPD